MAPVRGIKRSRSMEAKAADSAKEESVAVDGKLHKRPDDEEMARNCRIGAVEWKDKEGRRDTALTFTGKMIGVTVGDGPTAVKFTVHKDIFMKASKAFEKAAKGGDSAKFGDTSPEIFAVVLNWIYTDSIKMPKKEGEDEDVFSDLIKLYAVAEALAIPGLKNDVLDKVMIEACAAHAVPMGHLKDVYGVTTDASPLRKLMIDLAAYEVDVSEYASFKLPAEIWKDLAIVLKGVISKETAAPFEQGLKAYYERT